MESNPPHAFASIDEPSGQDAVAYYWELSDLDRARQEPHGLEEEGYLALDLNRAEALLQLHCKYESWPDVPMSVGQGCAFEDFADAVAAILQLAAWKGVDPVDVCDAALMSRDSVARVSTRAAVARTRAYAASCETSEQVRDPSQQATVLRPRFGKAI